MAEETKTTMETGTSAAAQTAAGASQEPEAGILAKVRDLLGLGKDSKKEPEKQEEATPPAADGKKTETAKNSEKGEPQETKELGQYSKDDLEAAIKKAREDLLAEQEEEKRLEKLSPEEKAAEEQEKVKKQNEELSGRIKRMELEQKASKALTDKKLPSGFSDFLDYSDEAKMEASLEKLAKMYQESLEAGINERLKGSTPKGLGGAANLTDGIVNAEIAKRIRGGL